MGQVDDFSDGEFEMVIAAAAYAINSLEDGSSKKQKNSVERLEKSLAKTKSKTEDNTMKPISTSGSFKRWFTIKDTKEDGNPGGVQRLESVKEMRPGQRTPTTIKTRSSMSGNKTEAENLAEMRKAESEADNWEKAQMIKVKNRYDKMISMIAEWEKEKKAKAKRQMEKKEHGPEQRRANALQKYRTQISRIDKVAGEARALAEERRRNDEAKIRDKAKKIRLTGKIPHACSCF